jgi:hypothetical protein
MMQALFSSKMKIYAVPACLFLAGLVLRVRQYLTGRSLWVDEAMLALNIVNRNMQELFTPLDYDQGAPLGFLLIENLFHLLLGRSEYALRLFPLILGILSMGLFHGLLQRLLRYEVARWIALALFVFNPRLIYYSSEVKQYIVDVFVTLMLMLLALPLMETRARMKDRLWFTAAGFLALWFSHPVLFVLAGIGLVLLMDAIQRRDFENLRATLGMGVLWVATIVLLYLLLLKDLQQNAYMKEYWQSGFLPLPAWSDLPWFSRVVSENIRLQLGIIYVVPLTVTLLLLGWFHFWKRQRTVAFTIAAILLMLVTASALHLYPVLERMILFTVPLGLLLLGAAVELLYESLPIRGAANTLVVLALAGFLLYGPVITAAGNFLRPRYYEHIHPAMSTLRDMWREGDVLFVTHGAVPAFEYYARAYGLEHVAYDSNTRQDYSEPQHIIQQLQELNGQPRVWVLMSHVYEKDGFNEKEFILDHLQENGTRKREFRMPGTNVYLYLYDLGN